MPDVALRVQRLADLSPDEARRRLERSAASIFTDQMREYARRVLDDVVRDRDEALIAYTQRWDGLAVRPEELRVSPARLRAAISGVDDALRQALVVAIASARRYNEWLRPPALMLEELAPGVTVGIRHTPVRSVGLYVPSGKGTFPSTLITMGIPAVVAGVERVAVVVPPSRTGAADPAVLAVADLLGITEVYCCNGAAGVAALAIGTEMIPRTDVIAGPGNPVVVAVQMAAMAYGSRPLLMLGPTESIVLADDSADPGALALDLLTEAEHGADSATILLCTDAALAEHVGQRLVAYLDRLPEPRRGYARRALSDLGGLFVVADLEEGLAWVDRYAPEHLQLAVRDPLAVAARVRHAGEVLAGQQTPFSVANYTAGVPAALPTGGAAFAASGLTVRSFLKATSVASLSRQGLQALAPAAARLGEYEGFPAHVMALTERREQAS